MAAIDDLIIAFELHSPERIRAALAAGADPLTPVDGKTPVNILVEMYLRSARFRECLHIMFEAGATLKDPALEALLLDDAAQLRSILAATPDEIHRRLSLSCAYTSLRRVSLLHVAAEYNAVSAARTLLDHGLDVNTRADVDEEGLGGHTPIFHAVNSNQNNSRPVMELLADAGADLTLRLQGVIWGGGFDWETVIYDVTPISYAQCGLYYQFHRPELQVYSNLAFLYERRYGRPLTLRNVPNRYLRSDKVFPLAPEAFAGASPLTAECSPRACG